MRRPAAKAPEAICACASRVRAASACLAKCTRSKLQVLIIHGKNDAIVPVMNSRELARIIPNATICELGDCGHNPQVLLMVNVLLGDHVG